MIELAPRPAYCMHDDTEIKMVIKRMIEKRISSVLVEDSRGHIVGIVTERDILRKITSLDFDMKYGRKISTIMTRPVLCVSNSNLIQDMRKLHQEKKLRHFPVVHNPKEPKVSELVGILTVTDLARTFLDNFQF